MSGLRRRIGLPPWIHACALRHPAGPIPGRTLQRISDEVGPPTRLDLILRLSGWPPCMALYECRGAADLVILPVGTFVALWGGDPPEREHLDAAARGAPATLWLECLPGRTAVRSGTPWTFDCQGTGVHAVAA